LKSCRGGAICNGAHRGRLNILANIFGKSTQDIFGEFEGKDYDKEYFDGDVKYHLGLTADKTTRTGKKSISTWPNPSHLETVGAVIEGITRAKQDKYFPNDFKNLLQFTVMPLLQDKEYCMKLFKWHN
jgi:2-oxoglutarate dehydrogenase E1 component